MERRIPSKPTSDTHTKVSLQLAPSIRRSPHSLSSEWGLVFIALVSRCLMRYSPLSHQHVIIISTGTGFYNDTYNAMLYIPNYGYPLS